MAFYPIAAGSMFGIFLIFLLIRNADDLHDRARIEMELSRKFHIEPRLSFYTPELALPPATG